MESMGILQGFPVTILLITNLFFRTVCHEFITILVAIVDKFGDQSGFSQLKFLRDKDLGTDCIYIFVFQTVRHEFTTILMAIVDTFGDQSGFSQLKALRDKDLEADFYENINHIQVFLIFHSSYICGYVFRTSRNPPFIQ